MTGWEEEDEKERRAVRCVLRQKYLGKCHKAEAITMLSGNFPTMSLQTWLLPIKLYAHKFLFTF